MPRPPEFANWPWDYAWWFLKSEKTEPGRARIGHLESGNYWDLHVRSMDALARQHLQDLRTTKAGQVVTMPDSRNLEIPYHLLDEEADMLQQRAMKPSPDRKPLTINCKDGTPIQGVPREWWEQLAANHIGRRKQEPAVVLKMGNGAQITVPYEFFDALCKDFSRRRGDMVAAGWWPELLMADYGQMGGPKPVAGLSNALGQGAQVMDGKQPAPGEVQHPAIEQQELA